MRLTWWCASTWAWTEARLPRRLGTPDFRAWLRDGSLWRRRAAVARNGARTETEWLPPGLAGLASSF
jgi:hypothetical protein